MADKPVCSCCHETDQGHAHHKTSGFRKTVAVVLGAFVVASMVAVVIRILRGN